MEPIANPRPVKPLAAPAPRPTHIRTPRDNGLFRGWGVSI